MRSLPCPGKSLGQFGQAIGSAFQIVDDALDVTGDPHQTGKAIGTDLIEGKPTLPVIYAMQDPVLGDEIRAIFETEQPTEDDVVKALGLIQRTDAIQRCLSLAEGMAKDAVGYLDVLTDSIYKSAFVDVADYVIRRTR